MKLLYKKSFTKSYQTLTPRQRQKIQDVFEIFIMNPFDQRLNNHQLYGKLSKLRSINAWWDLRILFQELSKWKYEIVEIIDVWSHNQLYW